MRLSRPFQVILIVIPLQAADLALGMSEIIWVVCQAAKKHDTESMADLDTTRTKAVGLAIPSAVDIPAPFDEQELMEDTVDTTKDDEINHKDSNIMTKDERICHLPHQVLHITLGCTTAIELTKAPDLAGPAELFYVGMMVTLFSPMNVMEGYPRRQFLLEKCHPTFELCHEQGQLLQLVPFHLGYKQGRSLSANLALCMKNISCLDDDLFWDASIGHGSIFGLESEPLYKEAWTDLQVSSHNAMENVLHAHML